MKILNASEMGKKGYEARVKKYGKKGLAKHAELMRNAKANKKANKDKDITDSELST